MGAGAALAARLRGSSRRVFVLVSDAECNEGSLWEAVMFAAHHGLGNLVAVIDLNGQQAIGYTPDVLDLKPMAARWEAFGWNVAEVDEMDIGHVRVGQPALVTSPSLSEELTGTVEEVRASENQEIQDLLNRRTRVTEFDAEAYLLRLTQRRGRD